MATEIDSNFELAIDKILISPDRVDDKPICTGIVERVASILTGRSGGVDCLIREIFEPSAGGQSPPPAQVIGTAHAHVIFNVEIAQEISIDGEDYFLIDSSDILGILPIPYEERLF